MELPAEYEGDYNGNERLGKLVSKLVPGNSLILSRLGEWYEANPYHKYHPGYILILNSRRRAGHGIRPVAFVEDYQMMESWSNPHGVQGMYVVTVSRDIFGDDNIWMKENKIPRCVERVTERNLVFKWNIEYRFKRVKCKNVEEALKLYRSIEVDPKSMSFTAEQISAPLKPGEISWGSDFPLDLQG